MGRSCIFSDLNFSETMAKMESQCKCSHNQSMYRLKKVHLKHIYYLPRTSVCRSQDEFSILNLGGFDCFWLYSLSERAKKQHFYPGDTIYTSIFLKIHVHILIVMLRIFLALIVLGNKLHHHLDDL